MSSTPAVLEATLLTGRLGLKLVWYTKKGERKKENDGINWNTG